MLCIRINQGFVVLENSNSKGNLLRPSSQKLWDIPDRIKELVFYLPRAPKRDARCLDFSPYSNHLGMKDHVENSGYEYSVVDIEPREESVQKEDICNLTFPDGHFDLIICSHILEHVLDTVGAIKQLYRVLSVDGICLFSVPCSFYKETQSIEPVKENHYHVWRFGYRHVRKLIEQVGFQLGLEVLRPLRAESNYLAIIHKGLPDMLFIGSLGTTKKIEEILK